MNTLENKKIAVLATDGYEQSELESPVKALKEAGATVEVISLKAGKIKSMKDHQWSDPVNVDKTLSEANVSDYDGLLLPGGVINPDALRSDKNAVKFVKSFFDANKPVAAICHGPQTLIEADVVKGKTMTSYQSISTDLKNAGAIWKDEEVITDGNLTTSRNPDDLPAFNKRIIEEFSK
ncbi:type 1 glutamine amidotransferase domain-containing protein [Kaistella jeonii]|uniref:Glutamine amidotransferase n=1 Tax=Kaistella jeonii TaxID=266749 RepID=A0A0C1D9A8_9FLAO|nr:type 1 glutamine amidotransferase domain-containing protein [Kaistella jeonii]KIA90455.1 glutamine amidotransferase [Kaistella jeonii]SFB72613.1 protease I [Kaistella jeonii]VEI94980.1 oxidative-stress-resistance chaperone [Kaistella jeonii]